jgi:hypothetical protein
MEKMKIGNKYLVKSNLEGKTTAILMEKKTVYIFKSDLGKTMVIPEAAIRDKVSNIEE